MFNLLGPHGLSRELLVSKENTIDQPGKFHENGKIIDTLTFTFNIKVMKKSYKNKNNELVYIKKK